MRCCSWHASNWIEPDDQACVREVREESGVTARIVESESGVYVCMGAHAGDLTRTRYYLMQLVASGAPRSFIQFYLRPTLTETDALAGERLPAASMATTA
jgi:ADP-ribose pyrophosphatase YjhB (NUDIX family)